MSNKQKSLVVDVWLREDIYGGLYAVIRDDCGAPFGCVGHRRIVLQRNHFDNPDRANWVPVAEVEIASRSPNPIPHETERRKV